MPHYVKKGYKSEINQSEDRLGTDLLVNTGQRKEPFIDTALILLAIEAQSFICCLQEPAW